MFEALNCSRLGYSSLVSKFKCRFPVSSVIQTTNLKPEHIILGPFMYLISYFPTDELGERTEFNCEAGHRIDRHWMIFVKRPIRNFFSLLNHS